MALENPDKSISGSLLYPNSDGTLLAKKLAQPVLISHHLSTSKQIMYFILDKADVSGYDASYNGISDPVWDPLSSGHLSIRTLGVFSLKILGSSLIYAHLKLLFKKSL